MINNENSKNTAEEKALRDLERAEGDLKEGDLRGARDAAEGAVKELEAAEKDDFVTIEVDGKERQVRKGKWVVSALKAALGIDPAKVLAEITPQGLKDLPDDATIDVHAKEQFMTHARSGGSS